MNCINKLFVIFIILIFIISSISTNANINQKTNTSSQKISDENSLGTIWITYYSLVKVDIRYEPPADYNYFFPEDENGFVYPNFTLHVCHKLGSPKNYFFISWIWPDNFIFTCIDIWLNYNGSDIISNETLKYAEGMWIGICIGLYSWGNVPFWKVLLLNISGLTAIIIIFLLVEFSIKVLINKYG